MLSIYTQSEYIMKYTIPDLLSKVDTFTTNRQVVDYLKSIDHPVIRTYLRYMFDERYKFDLPETIPSYRPYRFGSTNLFWSEMKRLYIFTKIGNPQLTQEKRLKLFLDLLENMDDKEAQALLALKNQESPWKRLTKKNVAKAYEGIFENG